MALLITSIIIGAAASSGDSSYALEDVDKLVAKAIVEKDRKQTAKATFKTADKDIKAFGKAHKKNIKAFKAELKQGNYEGERMDEILQNGLSERQGFQEKVVDYRLQFQELLTQEEWDAVVVKGIDLRKKELRKIDKAERKFDEKTAKKLKAVEDAIKDQVTDREKQTLILEKFDSFKGNLMILYHELQSYNYRENSVLPRKDATREEVRGLFGEFDNIRLELYAAFLDFAATLQDNAPEEQFLAVSKQVAKMF